MVAVASLTAFATGAGMAICGPGGPGLLEKGETIGSYLGVFPLLLASTEQPGYVTETTAWYDSRTRSLAAPPEPDSALGVDWNANGVLDGDEK